MNKEDLGNGMDQGGKLHRIDSLSLYLIFLLSDIVPNMIVSCLKKQLF